MLSEIVTLTKDVPVRVDVKVNVPVTGTLAVVAIVFTTVPVDGDSAPVPAA